MENLDLTYDDYLAHYGVKGMKWGVRKRRSSDSSGRSSKRKSSTSTSEPGRYEKRKKIAKGAASAAVVSAAIGGMALVYANRNSPIARRGISSVAKISNRMKDKTLDSVYDVKLNRMAKRGQKFNSQSQFTGKSIYEVANMTAPKQTRKSKPQVDRMMKKVDGGRSYKDALADEAVRYGAKLTGQYAKEKVRRKFSRQS